MGALLAATTVLAACGGGEETPRQSALATTERYLAALADGDGEAACEELSDGAVAELEERAAAPCAEAIDLLLEGLAEGAGEVGDAGVRQVRAEGDVATATIDGPRGAVVAELVLEDGEWKVASPGGR